MVIASRQRLNFNTDGNINITIHDQPIKKVKETETLGIDQHLAWSKHVEEKSKKVSSAIGALKRLRPFITIDVAIKIYKAIIQPHINYCSTVWDGLGSTLLDKIQKLQNRAARMNSNTVKLLYQCKQSRGGAGMGQGFHAMEKTKSNPSVQNTEQ